MKNCNCDKQKIDMAVCGPSGTVLPSETRYITKVIQPSDIKCGNIMLEPWMMSVERTKYVIKWDFDLDGKTITVPEKCALEFDGGSLKNGTIIGQDTYINDVGGIGVETLFGEGITREGTWRMNEGGGGTVIVDSELSDSSVNPVQNKVIKQALDSKQSVLRSGENIKTINGQSIVGSGDIEIEGGGGSVEQVQSDWAQNDSTKKDFIKNKPKIPQVPEIDYKPTAGSDNLVTSGGVYAAINDIANVEEGSGVTTVHWDTYYWSDAFDLNNGDTITVTPKHVTENQVVWSDNYREEHIIGSGFTYKATTDNEKVYVGFTGRDDYDYVIARKDSIVNSAVSYKMEQNLSSTQKAMARQNIGIDDEAISAGEDSKKVFLKMNMVDGKNVLTQDMFYKDSDVAGSRGTNDGESANGRVPNTDKIFVVQHDYDLDGETIELPEGTTLEFGGGSISNGRLSGVVLNKDFHPEWFGAVGDGVHDDTSAIQQCIDLSNKYGGSVLLSRAVYKVTHIDLKTKTHLKGVGIGASILKSEEAYEAGIVNVLENSVQCIISDLSIVGNKTQDGIYTQATNKDNPSYNMSYYLQENTGIENNKQTYRNLIIDNVYVGECRYGMNFNGYCYRVILTRSDIKRCVYGVNWPITDSSMHECYIERCDKDGLIVTGNNNNISNVKSIWNGQTAPYESFGMRLRGSRNRYSNLEAQDNYCSGIHTSGNENLYDNIIANGDGYEYDLNKEDTEGVSLCEWYINTLNCLYSNCEVSCYSNRNNNKFPTYPILYGADAALQDQTVHIIGYAGIPIARKALKARNHVITSPVFNIDGSKITYDKGYSVIGTEGFSSVSSGYNTPLGSEVTIIAELLIGEHELNKSIYLGYADSFMGITIRPNLTASGAISAGIPTSTGDVILSNLDKTKPIRCGLTSRITGKDDNNHFIYEASFGVWYYDNVQQGYTYKFSRKTDIASNKTGSQITNASKISVAAGDNRNDFYLRQVLVTDTPCVLTNVTYPGNMLYGLNAIVGFDYESAHGSLKPAIGDSEHRPTLVHTGARYFDTDLNRPLWFNGTSWVTGNGSDADSPNDIDEADVLRISKNVTEGIIAKEAYQSGWIRFTVKVNKTIDEGNPVYDNVECGLILPETYKPIGNAINLVVVCHGSGATIAQRMVDTTFMKIVNKLLDSDYAVLMCNGYGNTADESAHWGCKRAASGYRKAYEWAVRNYNLNSRFDVYGFSMGGLMAIQLGLTMHPNIKSIALGAPALDLQSCWTTDERKRRFALAYGFSDATVYEESKTKGCDPFKGIVSISDNSYFLLNLPPVKIWHGTADEVIAIEKSRTFTTANENSNNQVELVEVSNGTHSLCYGGDDTVTAAIAEWFERFDIPTKEVLFTSDNEEFMVVSKGSDAGDETTYEKFIVKV